MNEKLDPFEQRLRQHPLRRLPSEWRAEILAATGEAQTVRPPAAVVRPPFLTRLNGRLASVLWPHPVAWAGLAAIWIFVFALNRSIQDTAPVMAVKSPAPSPEMLAELRQQQRLYVQLIGGDPRESNDADRPKPFVPKPRTERDELLMS